VLFSVAIFVIGASAVMALSDLRLGVYGAAFVFGWAQLVGL
jgi:hypothetical protein